LFVNCRFQFTDDGLKLKPKTSNVFVYSHLYIIMNIILLLAIAFILFILSSQMRIHSIIRMNSDQNN